MLQRWLDNTVRARGLGTIGRSSRPERGSQTALRCWAQRATGSPLIGGAASHCAGGNVGASQGSSSNSIRSSSSTTMASTSERRGDDAAAKLSAASETAADTNFQSLRMTVETVERSMRLRGGQQRAHLKVASLGVVEDDSRGVHRSTIHERGRLEHDQPGRTLSERVRNGGHARLSRGVAAAASYKVGARPDTTAGRDLSLDEIDQDVEDQIQIAMANGDFDQLEGKGRPLARLSEPANPFVDDTERMGFKLMKQQGFVPDWIDRQQRIRKDMEQLVEQLAEAWYLGAAEPTLMYVARKDDFA